MFCNLAEPDERRQLLAKNEADRPAATCLLQTHATYSTTANGTAGRADAMAQAVPIITLTSFRLGMSQTKNQHACRYLSQQVLECFEDVRLKL